MDDIKRRDVKVFLTTLFGPANSLGLLAIIAIGLVMSQIAGFQLVILTIMVVSVTGIVLSSYKLSIPKRFHHPRFLRIWEECVDRSSRLTQAMAQLRRNNIADLQELPVTVARLSPEIYCALRRADMVSHEISKSEEGISASTGQVLIPVASDPQAQELYKIADRNLAEYSKHFRQAIAGVERAVAQAAVFSTTLDTLRIQMLGHRLARPSPEVDTMDFLNVVHEAKLQFQAIDSALEELDLSPAPKMVAVHEDSRSVEEEV